MYYFSSSDDINMEYRVQITVRQEWKDFRLKFNYSEFITLPEDMSRLWTPDLFFMNERSANLHLQMKPNVMIRVTPETGTVLLSIRLSLTLACPMNLRYYPLDRQTCRIRMGSYSWPTKDLTFMWKRTNPIQLPAEQQLPRFTMKSNNYSTCDHVTTTGKYSCLLATFTFQRELGYYMIQNFLPCGMIVMVSWISFWLGASTIDARVSLGITTMLTMVAQIYGINQAVPPVSYTKALDIFTGTCLVFIVMAIIEVSIVGYNIQLYKYRQTLPLPFTQNMKNRPTMGGHLLTRSNQVDRVSRFLFPISFLIFNIAY
ncbi:Glutamate-gated chloride channel [Folsomia candida]|uniref:Glutamate-gated chloride channel n=1 Tax=Folsomia candida TaxID=158441 RepID=A0A226EM96_FOLCA|nr:Glutamate-gated chloride channel [Folsomia candida]